MKSLTTVNIDRDQAFLMSNYVTIWTIETRQLLDSDSDTAHQRHSKAFGVYFDTSDSESISPSESEVFNTKLTDTVSNQSEIISTAEEKLGKVLNQLQGLWLNLHENDNSGLSSENVNLVSTKQSC